VGLWSRLARTVRGGGHDDDIAEELRFHLEMDIAEGRSAREARVRLGTLTRIHEETREAGIIAWLDSVLRDIRLGCRQLRRTPGLSVAVILSLTIGIGANTAIFSLVDAALLRPLPVADPGSLRLLAWTNGGFPPSADNVNGEFRPIAGGRYQGAAIPAYVYRRLAAEQTAFNALIGFGAETDAIAIATEGSPAEQVSVQYVSSNFFQGLGILPVLGRPFRDVEDRLGGDPVVIVSHRFWVNRLGRRPEALDRTIRINTVAAHVVGIAPPGFFGLRPGEWPDVFAPLAMKVAFQPNRSADAPQAEDDRNWWVRQMARLKPDVSEGTAMAQVASQFRNVAVPAGVQVEPGMVPDLFSLPGRHGLDGLNRADTDALWILMRLVGVVLLIVCVNVANLLLSRAVSRQHESAVRLALGAARSRLLRQHLLEGAVLAFLGGVCGLALGGLLAQSIHQLFQTGRDASSAFDLRIDARVLGYTGVVSILTALIFGLVPAVRASRADLNGVLKTQSRTVPRGLPKLPRVLVSIQIALCFAALVAAGLLGRSLEKLKTSDVGFDRNHLAYASVSPSRAGYTGDQIKSYVDRMTAELARLPGVVHVSPVQTRLLSGGGNHASLNIPGRTYQQGVGAHLNSVGDRFFETLGIPLLAGRALRADDIHPDSEAVIVDDLFVKQFFPDGNPLGRRFGIGPKESNRYAIVGVVGYSRYNSLRNAPIPNFYQAYRPGGTVHFAIRTSMDAAGMGEAVRRVIASVDPAVPLTEFHTQAGLIDRNLRTERLLSFVSAAFGLVALTLAAIGLGGLLAYLVARRTNEIGVRMALGASAGDVIRMVLGDSMSMVVAGILIGLPCAYAIGRSLQALLFQLEPLDPATAALSLAGLVAVALLAAWVPARRAATINPIVALREE
jgi:predicted permease